MRHPLRAGAGAGADGGDDGVELDTHPDVRAASMVPTVVSVPVNMSLWLLDAVGKSLARTWLYALGNLDTLLGWIVSRRHVAKVLRFTNAYFLVKALCISLLLLLLGTFNLSTQFFSLGLTLFHTMRNGHIGKLSSGIGDVLISYALVWNFRFIMTHVRGVLAEHTSGDSWQLPSWQKALTHHTRQSLISTYAILVACSCTYLAQHWYWGAVTTWPEWRKSYAAYLALGSKPALLVCWAQWVLLLMFAFPRPRWSVRSMDIPFNDDRAFPMMDTPTMAPASPDPIPARPATATAQAVGDLPPLPPGATVAAGGMPAPVDAAPVPHSQEGGGQDGGGSGPDAATPAPGSPLRNVFGAVSATVTAALRRRSDSPDATTTGSQRSGSCHGRSASVDQGLDDGASMSSGDDQDVPPRLTTRSLSMPAFPVAGNATQPVPAARARASSCFSDPVTQPAPHHVRALRTSLMFLSAVAVCRLVQDALWWTRLVPADNPVFFGYSFMMMAANLTGWMAWFGVYLFLAVRHNALPRHVDPLHPATGPRAIQRMVSKLQLIAVAVILLFFTIDFFDNRVGLRFGCDLMQVNIFFVVVSILVLSVLFDINQHKYWMRDTIAATIVSAVLAGFLWWLTGAQRWAALASLFLFLLNTNLEWFFGLYRVHEPRNRKMWRIFLGVAGAFGMFACGMWAIHTVQTRQDIFPTSIYFRVDPVEREVSFDHFHIIGLRLDVTNAALNGTSRPKDDTCSVPSHVAWLSSIDLFANSSSDEADSSDDDDGDACCCRSGDSGDGCRIIGGQGQGCRQCSDAGDHLRRRHEAPLFERMDHSGRRSYRYASCDTKWHGLSLLDFALLSQAGYFNPDSPQLLELLDVLFPAWMAPDNAAGNRSAPEHDQCTDTGPASASEGKREPLFVLRRMPERVTARTPSFEVYSAKLNTSVIVIRGTDPYRANDYLEDVRIWAEAGFFRIISFFPTMQLWSDRLTSMVIGGLINEQLSWFGLGFKSKDSYYTPLVNYVHSVKDRNVVLTGHSLGGGLAHIVGAFTGRPSVAFSPPGIVQTRRKLYAGPHKRLHARQIAHQSVSVIPDMDPVASVDVPAGLVQYVICNETSAMLGCHMMERTICELYSSCGDEAGRIRGCEFESMPQEIRVAIVDSLLSILFKALPVVAIVVIPMALHWVWGWVVFLN